MTCVGSGAAQWIDRLSTPNASSRYRPRASRNSRTFVHHCHDLMPPDVACRQLPPDCPPFAIETGASLEVIETITLIWTPCYYGEWRPWFRCLGIVRPCGRIARTLYGTRDLFLYRHWSCLAYQSPTRGRGRPSRPQSLPSAAAGQWRPPRPAA